MSGFLLDNYPASTVIKSLFHTFNAAGASVTVTGFAAADVTIYKDGSTTQRASAAGITVATDFDAITGVHQVSIDLGDNTDAGFYAVGSQYNIAISTFTADGQTVSFVLGSFRILAAEGVAGTPSVNTTHAAGTAWASGAITAAAIATDAIGAAELAADAVTEIQSGLATAASLTTVGNNVSAIKLKTDNITYTVGTFVDVNIQAVNDVTIQGTGALGNEWRP
jgi:hypothetical protein